MIITAVLPALADPSNAYYAQQQYVLTSLATVKSIVLLTDIPAADQLTTLLFTSFFDILAGAHRSSTGEQLGKNVQFNMTAILGIVVDESPNLPSEVIDVIVAQFLRIDPRAVNGFAGHNKKGAKGALDDRQSTFTMKELPASYNMAKTVCNSSPEKMARYISQYFNDVVVDASSSSSTAHKGHSSKVSNRKGKNDAEEDDLDLGASPTEDDLKELRKVHQLLRELWRACPGVLQNVIPQLEAELSAGNIHLRSLATETLGDIISGIGSAGLPPLPSYDPAAYPPILLSDGMVAYDSQNILTKPSSPRPFSQAHPHAYSSFLTRCHDKSPTIRSVWATAIGRIITTAAGGVGLSQQEEEFLIKELAKILGDADEKVRISAVKAVGTFSLRDVVFKLGAAGGIEKPGSVLANLAERVRDRKHSVRVEAMYVLGRLWGVASGALLLGEEQAISTLSAAPSRILDTYYANDLDIHVLIDHILFEQLLPLNFPPLKAKPVIKSADGLSQRSGNNQMEGSGDAESLDPNKIRVERILLLVKGLDDRAKKVFMAVQSRQLMLSRFMHAYLQRCEDYNGGVMEGGEKSIKEHLGRLINSLAKTFPDHTKVSEHLWKFAKMHDRRSYQLIRHCITPESDYRTVQKALKELVRRIRDLPSAPGDLLISLTPLLYRISILIYNKSHVPAIMEFSRTDESALAATAHELLRDISTKTPEVLKAQVQGICTALQDGAPSATRANDAGSLDNLKACASFASKFTNEIPKDRKLVHALTNFALHGTPAKTAKYAVIILMTISDRKESLARDLVRRCINGFQYDGEGFLARLAALSQLMLMAPDEVNEESDAVSDIAIEEILLKVRSHSSKAANAYEWSPSVDVECEAKCWSLQILVNRVRSHREPDTLTEIAQPVYQLLDTLIRRSGETTPSGETPPTHKSRLRLHAARQCLKLGLKKSTDALVSAKAFNTLSLVAQDHLLPVRSSFLQRLKKYLGQTKLPQRYYTIPFLLAFEPNQHLKSDTVTWIRSRAAIFSAARSDQSSMSRSQPVMESVFARLISLLAHHPDYANTEQDLKDFARYIIFYLHNVASEENISLIYQIAQRVKQCRGAIMPDSSAFDQNLYHLSDLAQLTIRKFEDIHGWSIQTLPGKISLPRSLYVEIKDHVEAQEIAEQNYLPLDMEDDIEALARHSMRIARAGGKKRHSDGDDVENGRAVKKTKSLPIRRTPAVAKGKRKSSSSAKAPKRATAEKTQTESEPPSSDRRRSGRVHDGKGKYVERDDADDDREMAEGVAEWIYENEAGEYEHEIEESAHDDDNGQEGQTNDITGEEEVNDDDNGSTGDKADTVPRTASHDDFDVPISPPKPPPRQKRIALKGRSSNPSAAKPKEEPLASAKPRAGRKTRLR